MIEISQYYEYMDNGCDCCSGDYMETWQLDIDGVTVGTYCDAHQAYEDAFRKLGHEIKVNYTEHPYYTDD